jgi:uncharacterized membrane protein YfcA
MMTLGYVLAVLMGGTLGLVGAGGSILTVPILVYLMGVPPLLATGYSLLLVGSAALVGSISYWRQGLVDWRAVLMFVVPSIASVLLTRLWIVPAIPDSVFGVSKAIVLMLFFSSLMIVAARFMLTSSPTSQVPAQAVPLSFGRLAKMILGSAGVGFLSGMVGAGGGFLIIPSLMALFGLPIKKAIGASLTIIAINSLVGFAGDVSAGIALDWAFLSRFLSLTLLGMGMVASRRIQAASLTKGLGLFTLLVGLAVLMQSVVAIF